MFLGFLPSEVNAQTPPLYVRLVLDPRAPVRVILHLKLQCLELNKDFSCRLTNVYRSDHLSSGNDFCGMDNDIGFLKQPHEDFWPRKSPGIWKRRAATKPGFPSCSGAIHFGVLAHCQLKGVVCSNASQEPLGLVPLTPALPLSPYLPAGMEVLSLHGPTRAATTSLLLFKFYRVSSRSLMVC